MLNYRHLRPVLFRLDPERAHNLAVAYLETISRSTLLCRWMRARYAARAPSLAVNAMGLAFSNPVGLAAGFDKDARCLRALAALGFGHVELGSVTPRPQPGNPRPRMFRLTRERAVINRMGFNSRGIDGFVQRLRRQRPGVDAVVGVNLGKNRDTPLARAHEDYLAGLDAVHMLADYVALNISSPNTEGLRGLQARAALDTLLGPMAERREHIARDSGRRVPLAVKIAPDLADDEVTAIVESAIDHGIDALIATNTTIARPGLDTHPLATEAGGLSGTSLGPLANEILGAVRAIAGERITVIGVGGVGSVTEAWEKFEAGADLVQLYTGFVFEGLSLPSRLVRGLSEHVPASESGSFDPTIKRLRMNRSSPTEEPAANAST